jgi:tetratricopeptide (TPR) repeat protein
MLKAMLPLTSMLGVLYAVPLAIQDQAPRTLQSALDETVRSLDVLRGIATVERPDVGLVRAATETPLSDANERLARLDRLHGDLSRLEAHLELLRSGVAPATAFVSTPTGASPVPTLGLGDGEIARLIEATRTPVGPAVETTDAGRERAPRSSGGDTLRSNNETPSETTAVTTDGTNTGGVLPPPPMDESLIFAKARAAYLAGQFDRALAAFQSGPDDPRHRYWRALCLDRLGRVEEALALYDVVIGDADGGEYVERARSDADFLRWKSNFGKPQPAPVSEEPAEGAPTEQG